MSSALYAIGLGSNLGDRRANVRNSVEAIRVFANVEAASSLYETEAIGPPQPPYLNAAVLVRASLSADELLEALLGAERQLGRVRGERWGPRTIDLDILWSPGLALTNPRVIVPHPELRNRAFALAPLLEVAPAARDPHTGEAYGDCLARLGGHGVKRLSGTAAGRWQSD